MPWKMDLSTSQIATLFSKKYFPSFWHKKLCLCEGAKRENKTCVKRRFASLDPLSKNLKKAASSKSKRLFYPYLKCSDSALTY